MKAQHIQQDVPPIFKTMHVSTVLEKAALPTSIVRQVYDMVEIFEAQLEPGIDRQQRTDEEFEAWRRDWFLGEVQKEMEYILLLDHLGLRAFVSYAPQNQDKQISICNLFIRPSAQGDGQTFKCLILHFLAGVEILPADRIHMSTHKRNMRVQKLALKLGFMEQERTDKDIRYAIEKSRLLQRFACVRKRNKPDQFNRRKR